MINDLTFTNIWFFVVTKIVEISNNFFSTLSKLKMEEQKPLVSEDTVHNRLFGIPEVLDKNVDDIIVNECDISPPKPPDR